MKMLEKRPVIDARPPMGPQALRQWPLTKWLRPATGGATPSATALDRPASVALNNHFSVNQQPKSVTYVLTHKCYRCPDCAVRVNNAEPRTLTSEPER